MATFTIGTEVLNIPNLEGYGGSRTPKRQQGYAMTLDGRVIVEDLAGSPTGALNEEKIIIPLAKFTQSIMDDLLDFIKTHLKWSGLLFTFLDDLGATYNNVRMVFTELEIVHITNSKKITQLTMISMP